MFPWDSVACAISIRLAKLVARTVDQVGDVFGTNGATRTDIVNIVSAQALDTLVKAARVRAQRLYVAWNLRQRLWGNYRPQFGPNHHLDGDIGDVFVIWVVDLPRNVDKYHRTL